MNIAVLQNYLALKLERERVSAREKELKSAMSDLATVVANEFDAESVQSARITVDGETRTLARNELRVPVYRDGVTNETLKAALKANDETSYMVTESFDTKHFGAWCREQEREGTMPKDIAALIEMTGQPRISVTKV